MNTFRYLSSLSRPSSPPSSPTTPSSVDLPTPSPPPTAPEEDDQQPTIDPDSGSNVDDAQSITTTSIEGEDEGQGTTLYISARRSEVPGEPPTISFSQTVPKHLVEKLKRRKSGKQAGTTTTTTKVKGEEFDEKLMEKDPESVVITGLADGVQQKVEEQEDQWEEKRGVVKASTAQVVNDNNDTEDEKPKIKLDPSSSSPSSSSTPLSQSEEDLEGERLLSLKLSQQQHSHYLRTTAATTSLATSWPFRLSASLYVLIRHFLSFFGVPYDPRSRHNALLAPPITTKTKEEPPSIKLTTSTDTDSLSSPPTPTRPSFFLSKPSPSPPPPLQPKQPPRLIPKTLVLDLDETLIHSTSRPYANNGKRSQGLKVRVVEVVLEGRSTVYTVYKRPWVDFFLRKVSSWYTVIIFTASLPEYADPVIDWLDGGDGGGGMVGGRLFRSDCVHANGAYVKDLSVVDADLSRVCLVDNSPVSYAINQANGIPIEGWINDPNDECLLDLLPMLDSLRFTSDVRRVLGLRGFGK